jgi:hypothetical protein
MSGVGSGNARILSQELRKPDLQVDQGGADANAIADHGGQPTAARRTFSPNTQRSMPGAWPPTSEATPMRQDPCSPSLRTHPEQTKSSIPPQPFMNSHKSWQSSACPSVQARSWGLHHSPSTSPKQPRTGPKSRSGQFNRAASTPKSSFLAARYRTDCPSPSPGRPDGHSPGRSTPDIQNDSDRRLHFRPLTPAGPPTAVDAAGRTRQSDRGRSK